MLANNDINPLTRRDEKWIFLMWRIMNHRKKKKNRDNEHIIIVRYILNLWVIFYHLIQGPRTTQVEELLKKFFFFNERKWFCRLWGYACLLQSCVIIPCDTNLHRGRKNFDKKLPESNVHLINRIWRELWLFVSVYIPRWVFLVKGGTRM